MSADVPNIVVLDMCFKMHLVKVGAFAWYRVKICVIFGVRFEGRKVEISPLQQCYTM